MKNHFWTSEKLLSLSALLVSLLTLVVFVYQTRLIQKQQYMSVYPHLVLSNFYSGSLNYKYALINQGIGPAIIQKIEVRDSSGKSYESITDYLITKISKSDSIWIYNSDIYEGRFIPAEQEIALFGMVDQEETEMMNLPPNTIDGANYLAELLNSDDLLIEITYKSIYDESWTISNQADVPIQH